MKTNSLQTSEGHETNQIRRTNKDNHKKQKILKKGKNENEVKQ